MSPSDIKDCGRRVVHAGHHWYEPEPTHPAASLAAYGLSGSVRPDEVVPPVKGWYCRGVSGYEGFRITVTIQPEPGTPGPFGGDSYTVRKGLEAHTVVADVDAVADSHQTVLALAARSAAQEAVWRYHEQMLRERAEAEGRPYLDESRRAQARYEAQALTPLMPEPTPAPDWDLIPNSEKGQYFGGGMDGAIKARHFDQRRDEVRRIVAEANRRQPQPQVYDPSTDTPEHGWTRGLTIRQCAYCQAAIVRIEPAPGYSEWTTNAMSTAGQECEHGPNRLHAPMAEPVTGAQDTAY